MSIEHTKEQTHWPVLQVLLVVGPQDVECDGHSILVVISHDAFIRIGGVSFHNAITLGRILGRDVLRENDLGGVWNVRTQEVDGLGVTVASRVRQRHLGFLAELSFRVGLAFLWCEREGQLVKTCCVLLCCHNPELHLGFIDLRVDWTLLFTSRLGSRSPSKLFLLRFSFLVDLGLAQLLRFGRLLAIASGAYRLGMKENLLGFAHLR